tara:strand:- start:3222 stop:3905 length:684 start_codon:yes stop_codon:yes gene_type:complete
MRGKIDIIGRSGVHHHLSQDVIGVSAGSSVLVTSTKNHTVPATETPLSIIVADGLGAHPIGRTAAVISVVEILRGIASEASLRACKTAALIAHQRLQQISSRRGFRKCAGAAVAGIVIREGQLLAFSAGDVGVFVRTKGGLTYRVFQPERTSTGGLINCLGGSYGDQPWLLTREIASPISAVICSDGVWEDKHFKLQEERAESMVSRIRDGDAPADDCALVSVVLDG